MSDTAEYEEDSHLQLHFAQVEQNFELQIATVDESLPRITQYLTYRIHPPLL